MQQAVIGAVDGRLHEHRAVDAHRVVQRLHRLEGAVLRRLIKRVRVADRIGLGVAEDMQMRVAGILRQAFGHERSVVAYCSVMLASLMIGPHLARLAIEVRLEAPRACRRAA